MNKILLIIFLTATYAIGQNKSELDNIKGVEIFLFKNLCLNSNSYIELDFESRKQFIANYKDKSEIPLIFCPEYINPNLCELEEKPFLQEEDIESFNWNSGELVLTNSGLEKISELKYRYHGEPFSLKVKNQSILYGWFWYYASSAGCTRVSGMVKPGVKEIYLKFGDGNYYCGPNPFLDKKLIEQLVYLQQ